MQKHQNGATPFTGSAAAQGDAVGQGLLEGFYFYHGKEAISVDV
jgi:hypothetical protein